MECKINIYDQYFINAWRSIWRMYLNNFHWPKLVYYVNQTQLLTRGLKSYIIPRHRLGQSFSGHNYLESRFVVVILNFSVIICTFPWCGCKIWIISDFYFCVFAPTRHYEVHPWRPFWISVKPSRIICTSLYRGEWDCKIWIISDFKFLRPQKNMKLIRDGFFEFQQNLKKSPAHFHIVGNVIVKCE